MVIRMSSSPPLDTIMSPDPENVSQSNQDEDESQVSPPETPGTAPFDSATQHNEDMTQNGYRHEESSITNADVADSPKMPLTVVDKLKNIRPFTEGQLLALQPIPQLESSQSYVDSFFQMCIKAQDTLFYAELSKLKKWMHLLEKTKTEIRDGRDSSEVIQENVWSLHSKTVKEKGRCSDGRLVEVTHSFQESIFYMDEVDLLDKNLERIEDILSTDYSYNHFMTQYTRKMVQVMIKDVLDLPEGSQEKHVQIQLLMTCLFGFLRTEDPKSEFFQCTKDWLIQMVSTLLKDGTHDDRILLLHHVLRCSGGISGWAIGFIQCPSPSDARDMNDALDNLNHCLLMMHFVLSPIQGRDKFLGITNKNGDMKYPPSETVPNKPKTPPPLDDDVWLLVDADTSESEEVFVNRLNFTEQDIMSLLHQIPFFSVVKFITEGSHLSPEGAMCPFGDYSETTMFKLLAISTRIISILKEGLSTFNCMQFKSLIEHITLLIRTTVRGVSKFWSRCRDKLNTGDEALILRLQVEYDHFILRSITTILGSQRYGVWKFISVIPFKGVTESMMWHILWVFYNNGKDEEDQEHQESGPYNSLSHWRQKFDDPNVKLLFRDKLLSLSPAEGQCLLETLGNMARSRNSREVDLVTMIASEMLERSFMLAENDKLMAQKCTSIFTELARIHPFFISSLISKIKTSATRNESILEAVSEIPIDKWIPDQETLDQLTEWLINTSINHFSNRLARIFLTKINWSATCQKQKRIDELRNSNSEPKNVHLRIDEHRNLAVKIYAAAKMHVYSDITQDQDVSPLSISTFSDFDGKTILSLANSFKPRDFIEWCWRILLSLKLHSFEQQAFGSSKDSSKNKKSESTSSLNSLPEFSSLPNIESDTSLLPVAKGLQNKVPFAVYITLSMTETGHRPDLLESNLDLLISLVNSKNYIQFLSILSCFVPLNIDQSEVIIKSKKFISCFVHLILWDQNKVLDRLLGLIKKQLETHSEAKIKILSFWTNLFYDTICFSLKQSSSWFSLSLLKGHQQTLQQKVVHLLDSLMGVTFDDEDLQNYLVKFISDKPFDELFFKQISSSGLLSFLSFGSSQSSKSCEWITPFHVLQVKFPDKHWLRCLIIKSDMIKMDQYWMDIVSEMNVNFEISDEDVIKRICSKRSVGLIPLDLLPINAWAKLIIDIPVDHTHVPIICYNFFKCFFSSSSHSGSVGLRFIHERNCIKSLKTKISKMVDYQYSLWSTVASGPLVNFHSETTKLYRAFLKWLDDPHLHDPFVDLLRLPAQYYVDVLQKVMEEENEGAVSPFINRSLVIEREDSFKNLWREVKEYTVDKNNASNPNSKSQSEPDATEDEDRPKPCPTIRVESIESFIRVTSDEIRNSNKSALASLIQHNIRCIMDDTKYFDSRLQKLHEVNKSLVSSIPEKYKNTSKDIILTATCDKDGYDENGCSGAAKIRMCFSEATENMTISREMEHNRIEFSKCLLELMDIPSDKSVDSLIHVEKFIHLLSTKYNGPSAAGPFYTEDQELLHRLLNYFLNRIVWSHQGVDHTSNSPVVNDVSSKNVDVKIVYPPTKHLLKIFMDSISKDDRLFYLKKYFPSSKGASDELSTGADVKSDHQLMD